MGWFVHAVYNMMFVHLQSIEDLCVQYDRTVRTSVNDIVQLVYSGDGLDPVEMEGNSKPMDFQRVLDHIQVGGIGMLTSQGQSFKNSLVCIRIEM